mgnify:CR=1 FL=1
MTENETVSVNASTKSCNTCQSVNEDLLRCSKCKMVFYCNQQCQKEDWKFHKLLCGKSQNPEFLSEKSLNNVPSHAQESKTG